MQQEKDRLVNEINDLYEQKSKLEEERREHQVFFEMKQVFDTHPETFHKLGLIVEELKTLPKDTKTLHLRISKNKPRNKSRIRRDQSQHEQPQPPNDPPPVFKKNPLQKQSQEHPLFKRTASQVDVQDVTNEDEDEQPVRQRLRSHSQPPPVIYATDDQSFSTKRRRTD